MLVEPFVCGLEVTKGSELCEGFDLTADERGCDRLPGKFGGRAGDLTVCCGLNDDDEQPQHKGDRSHSPHDAVAVCGSRDGRATKP